MNLSVRLVSNVQRDQLLLKSLLAIVGHRGTIDWTYSLYDNHCDVAIVDIDSPHPNLDILKKLYGAKSLVAYGDTPTQAPMIDGVLSKPLRAKELNTVLAHIESILGIENKHAPESAILEKLHAASAAPSTPTPKPLVAENQTPLASKRTIDI